MTLDPRDVRSFPCSVIADGQDVPIQSDTFTSWLMARVAK